MNFRSLSLRNFPHLLRIALVSTIASWPFLWLLGHEAILVDYPGKDRILLAALSVLSASIPFALLPWRAALLALWPWMALSPLEALHIQLYQASTSLGILGAVVDTNPAEAAEFLGGSWPWLVAAVVVLLAWPLLLLPRFVPVRALGWRGRLALVGLFVVLLFVHWERQVRRHGDPLRQWNRLEEVLDQAWPAGGVAKVVAIAREKMRARLYLSSITKDSWRVHRVAASEAERETWVLVLGESSRADRWGVCGHGRNTTPSLAEDTALAIFCDVASGANITNEAVSYWFTLATPQDPGAFHDSSPVLQAFREAGFRTWWISSQGRFGLNDSRVSLVASLADSQWFLPRDAERRGSFDGYLLPLLERALQDSARRKFIVLHTMGSHLRYDFRYPDSFDRFQPSLLSTKGWDHTKPAWAPVFVNSYDNSVLYTDWMVEQVLGRVRSSSGIRGVLYVSDHGEQLWEDASCPLGHGAPDPVRSEFHVPLVAWASPEQRAAHPGQWDALMRHRASRVGAGDLVPTLLDLAGISSPRSDSTRNLAAGGYREHRRWARTSSGRLVDVDTVPAKRVSDGD